MELLSNPQFHSQFACLGSMQGEKYVVNDECMATLEEINMKLSLEDHTLRTYRRAIGFGQNMKKDIVPLLINAKDPKVLDSAIRLVVNLTVPIECLLSVEVMSRTEIGRHTIYELNRLLYTAKEVFVEIKATKAIVDYMKHILESDHKLTLSQCESVNNCLLLLRNILHIPENVYQHQQQPPQASMQNQILWNLFTQSIDKLLIHMMSCPQKSVWGVTIVQLIALMYKDQHVGTLQKLLNHWFDAASFSETSDDNESNTTPPKLGSDDSSPMLTSDPTSDSSDNGSGKMALITDVQSGENLRLGTTEFSAQLTRVKPKLSTPQTSFESTSSSDFTVSSNQDYIMRSPSSTSTSSMKVGRRLQKPRIQPTSSANNQKYSNKQKKSSKKCLINTSSNQSEVSDCGYGTQASQGGSEKKRDSISTTSSNDDDSPKQKPIHQKPPCTNQKQRFNAAQKQRNATNASSTLIVLQQEKNYARRKKLVKRSKSSIINMKGLIHHMPTDDDISNILKEFTVDFLLKGYGFLVQELHQKLLTDTHPTIDTSHFFWLVTYFLKFAAQLELDLEHIKPILSFDVISHLTFEGVHLCEQLELTSRQEGTDLKPYLRRLHLVVTAIREFLHTHDIYKKSSHLSAEDKKSIEELQLQIAQMENLRQLFVLLLRCYNPSLQSKQYLQDLVVTNQILLLLLDNVSKSSESPFEVNMIEHVKQFATVDIMRHYGTLLENFQNNGEFVNDCIFTMMHHIGGDLEQVSILFQPSILKTLSQIWDNEYEICNDWSDLIEYVIHKFINTPPKPKIASLPSPVLSGGLNDDWTKEEMDTLYWYYVQSKKLNDVIGNITCLIKDSGHIAKTRIALLQQLMQQDIVTTSEYDVLMKFEDSQLEREAKSKADLPLNTQLIIQQQPDDIRILRDRLLSENKGKFLQWLQLVLIECCYIKLNIVCTEDESASTNQPSKPIMEPIPYHYILKQQAIPLVPFNTEQSKILVYQPFLLLLHKLGFHLPADANKLFVRIPEFWTADIMFSVVERLGPIPKHNLKFDVNRLRPSKRLKVLTIAAELKVIDDDNLIPTLSPTAVDSSLLTVKSFTSKASLNAQHWIQMVATSKTTVVSKRTDDSKVLQPATIASTVHTFLQPLLVQKRRTSYESLRLGPSRKEGFRVEKRRNSIAENFETSSVGSGYTQMCVSEDEEAHET